jgi:adenylate kinase
MLAGQLVPDDVVVGIVVDRLTGKDCARGCLFDGFPRTVPQAEALDRMLAERRMPLDLVLALEVPEKKLVERLSARGRPDDDCETILERFRQYNTLTQPVLDYYGRRGILRRIDGDAPPDEVFNRVRRAVDEAMASNSP